MKKFWLMKSEPETYSIDDLAKAGKTLWEGVRNYQARNFMIDMQIGDAVLFYHSSSDPAGVAGLARVSKAAQPDPTALKKGSPYYDPKSTPEKPIWSCVEIEFVMKAKRLFTLAEARTHKVLSEMLLLKKGQRLSIQPVLEKHFQFIQKRLDGKDI